MTTQTQKPAIVIDVAGLKNDLKDQYRQVTKNARKQGIYGWIWNITGLTTVVAGILATAIAGVGAVSDYLSKTTVGVIAISAALSTALASALPYTQIAIASWTVSDKNSLLGRKIDATLRELGCDPPQDHAGMKHWNTVLRHLSEEEAEIRQESAQIARSWTVGPSEAAAATRKRRHDRSQAEV